MSAILLCIPHYTPEFWERQFRAQAPSLDIRVWPDRIGDPGDIRYVCAWRPPAGALAGLKNLQAIFSLGAGVDHLIGDATLPDVPIARIVDPDLTARMTEYVTLHVLMHHRRQRLWDARQRDRDWREDEDQPAAREVAVGVMGLGVLGSDAAEMLQRLRFDVAGWSRTPKSLPGIATFHGNAALDDFLARTEILVCLLPHTTATEGILNLALFRKLKRDGALGGASLVNAGRGRLQVEADIVAALDEGVLSGATLDVFATEPLPPANPLWTHPGVTITPHNAAISAPGPLVDNILQQIARVEAGEPLRGTIDRAVGY